LLNYFFPLSPLQADRYTFDAFLRRGMIAVFSRYAPPLGGVSSFFPHQSSSSPRTPSRDNHVPSLSDFAAKAHFYQRRRLLHAFAREVSDFRRTFWPCSFSQVPPTCVLPLVANETYCRSHLSICRVCVNMLTFLLLPVRILLCCGVASPVGPLGRQAAHLLYDFFRIPPLYTFLHHSPRQSCPPLCSNWLVPTPGGVLNGFRGDLPFFSPAFFSPF